MSERTLYLTKPFGSTFLASVVILLIFFGIGEILVRQPVIFENLNTPTLNIRHRHFERQWDRLEKLTASGVEINCIALGNSMVLNGFDPELFAENFEHESGRKLSCFNFGVDALTPVSASAIAQILVDTYHPELIIFGTDSRDFAISRDSEETSVIYDSPWIQYRLGNFNIEGWFVENFRLYRQRWNLQEILNFSYERRVDSETQRRGSEPLEEVADISIPPDPDDPSYHIQYYYRTLKSYKVLPENRAALERILDLINSSATEVVVVEMPIPNTYFDFFDNPESDYASFIQTLSDCTIAQGVVFLETTSKNLIPVEGWMDYSHVNRLGARVFSEWLGLQLGRLFGGELATRSAP